MPIAALLAVLCGGSCTAITDPEEFQCESDGDCTKFGPSLCSEDRVCVSLACSTTAECQGRFAGPGYCRTDGQCVSLLTEDCTRVYPAAALEEDDVVLFGFMGPIKEPDTYGLGPLEGVEFALDNFGDVASTGLPGASQGSPSRHLAMLVCHHGDDTDQAVAVAQHLTQNVQVPAIIGPGYSGIAVSIFDLVVRPAGTLMLSPSATSPDLTDLKATDELLLWRTVPSDLVQAEALKSLAPVVVEAVTKREGIALGDVEFGIAFKDDNAGRGLRDQVLFRNPAFPNAAAGITAKHSASYPKADASSIDWQGVWEDLVETGYPHVILPLGTEEFASSLLRIVEEEWPEDRPRPWYLMPEGNRGGALQSFVERNPERALGERVLGTAPGARRGALYERFSTFFEQATNRSPRNLAEFGYDAAFLFAYSVLKSGKQFPTGRDLGKAMTQMTCKGANSRELEASVSNVFRGINLAMTGECLDFAGASGPVDFEGEEREVLADIALWCVRTEDTVTVDQNLETYYAVTDFPEAPANANKGLVRQDPALDLTSADWCNANTSGP